MKSENSELLKALAHSNMLWRLLRNVYWLRRAIVAIASDLIKLVQDPSQGCDRIKCRTIHALSAYCIGLAISPALTSRHHDILVLRFEASFIGCSSYGGSILATCQAHQFSRLSLLVFASRQRASKFGWQALIALADSHSDEHRQQGQAAATDSAAQATALPWWPALVDASTAKDRWLPDAFNQRSGSL